MGNRVAPLAAGLLVASLWAAPVRVVAGLTLTVQAEGRVRAAAISRVRRELPYLYTHIGRDLRTYPRRLKIELFATHRPFAAALWRQQRARPQSGVDDSGTIVHGLLLLGPLPATYLRHNLAHTYTEWLIDQLTGNSDDVLPPETWLYDGLAEAEAYRYEPAGMRCSGGGRPLLDVTQIHSAREWLAIRAGPLESVEYCLAALKSRQIISRLGWPRIDAILRGSGGWLAAARTIERLAP